jgi:hypothetical protein
VSEGLYELAGIDGIVGERKGLNLKVDASVRVDCRLDGDSYLRLELAGKFEEDSGFLGRATGCAGRREIVFPHKFVIQKVLIARS